MNEATDALLERSCTLGRRLRKMTHRLEVADAEYREAVQGVRFPVSEEDPAVAAELARHAEAVLDLRRKSLTAACLAVEKELR